MRYKWKLLFLFSILFNEACALGRENYRSGRSTRMRKFPRRSTIDDPANRYYFLLMNNLNVDPETSFFLSPYKLERRGFWTVFYVPNALRIWAQREQDPRIRAGHLENPQEVIDRFPPLKKDSVPEIPDEIMRVFGNSPIHSGHINLVKQNEAEKLALKPLYSGREQPSPKSQKEKKKRKKKNARPNRYQKPAPSPVPWSPLKYRPVKLGEKYQYALIKKQKWPLPSRRSTHPKQLGGRGVKDHILGKRSGTSREKPKLRREFLNDQRAGAPASALASIDESATVLNLQKPISVPVALPHFMKNFNNPKTTTEAPTIATTINEKPAFVMSRPTRRPVTMNPRRSSRRRLRIPTPDPLQGRSGELINDEDYSHEEGLLNLSTKKAIPTNINRPEVALISTTTPSLPDALPRKTLDQILAPVTDIKKIDPKEVIKRQSVTAEVPRKVVIARDSEEELLTEASGEEPASSSEKLTKNLATEDDQNIFLPVMASEITSLRRLVEEVSSKRANTDESSRQLDEIQILLKKLIGNQTRRNSKSALQVKNSDPDGSSEKRSIITRNVPVAKAIPSGIF